MLCNINLLLLRILGRWNKKQLNPVLIYGIRCHLIYKFSITNKEWQRLRLNMDSKCRSAWKKRIKNLQNQSKNPGAKVSFKWKISSK